MTTIREIIRSIDLTECNGGDGMTHADAIEYATFCAIQLGYDANTGTGGAYADLEVSADDAEEIADLVANTDADGVYRVSLSKLAGADKAPRV